MARWRLSILILSFILIFLALAIQSKAYSEDNTTFYAVPNTADETKFYVLNQSNPYMNNIEMMPEDSFTHTWEVTIGNQMNHGYWYIKVIAEDVNSNQYESSVIRIEVFNTTKGVIPTTHTPGIAFFITPDTETTNPKTNTIEMGEGDSFTITWTLNTTGPINSTWELNAESCDYNNSCSSDAINVTITEILAPEVTYDINPAAGVSLIRFQNCSPDWETYPSYPEGQVMAEEEADSYHINNTGCDNPYNANDTDWSSNVYCSASDHYLFYENYSIIQTTNVQYIVKGARKYDQYGNFTIYCFNYSVNDWANISEFPETAQVGFGLETETLQIAVPSGCLAQNPLKFKIQIDSTELSDDNKHLYETAVDWGNTVAIIKAQNTGNTEGHFQIRLTGTPSTGWTIYATPNSWKESIKTLSTTWDYIHTNVSVNEIRYVWLFANCSYVSQNPGVSVEMNATT